MKQEFDHLDEGFIKLMQKKQKEIDAGKTRNIRDIKSVSTDKKHDNFHEMKCEKFSYMRQSNSKEKYFIIERWVRLKIHGTIASKDLKEGDVEYRFAYYIVSRKPNSTKEGQWVFGQFSPMIGHEDLMSLLELARKEGTITA